MYTLVHFALSLLGGCLMILAWPATGSITPLVFIGFIPFMYIVEQRWSMDAVQRKRGLGLLLLPGLFLWNMVTTTWLGNVQEEWATRFLTGYLVMLANSGLMLIPFALMKPVRRQFGRTMGWAAFILFWLAFEHLHMDWDLTWPWLTLGNVFAPRPELVQWYEITGHLGGSLWVLIMNILVLHVVCISPIRTGASKRMAWVAAAVLLIPVVGSLWRYNTYNEQGRKAQVVVVQPNVDPYSEKFNAPDPVAQVDGMLDLAEPFMNDSVELVVLPETALQEDSRVGIAEDGSLIMHGLWESTMNEAKSVVRIKEWLRRYPRTALITGMSSYRLYGPHEDHPAWARPMGGTDHYYDAANSALFVDERGGTEVYVKSKLVAGVELLPFESLLGSIEALSIDMGGTTGSLARQEEREVLPTGGGMHVAPVICYESVFGAYVGGYIRNGADLIAIITNDGWWGDTPGYHQHMAYGRLRAVEHRRDVVRSANTGISCTIDQRGDVFHTTGWWVPDAFLATVTLNSELTFFSRHGQYLGTAALWLGLAALIGCFLRAILGRSRSARTL